MNFRGSNCPHVSQSCYHLIRLVVSNYFSSKANYTTKKTIDILLFCTGFMPLPGGLQTFPNLQNVNITMTNMGQVLPPGGGGLHQSGTVSVLG